MEDWPCSERYTALQPEVITGSGAWIYVDPVDPNRRGAQEPVGLHAFARLDADAHRCLVLSASVLAGLASVGVGLG